MVNLKCCLTGIICCLLSTIYAQSDVVGIWKNIDDEDGKAKSHIEVYYHEGKVYSKVIKLLDNATITNCTKCKGDKKNQSLEGMIIMWDMEPDGDHKWSGGRILDPKSGKEYKCKIALESSDKLKVRGYVGMPAFGRTQYWYRVTHTDDAQ